MSVIVLAALVQCRRLRVDLLEDEPVPALNQTRDVHLPDSVGVSEDLEQADNMVEISCTVLLDIKIKLKN